MMTMNTARYVPLSHFLGHDRWTICPKIQDSDNNTILILLAEARPPLSSSYGSGPSDHEFFSANLRMARLYYDHYPDILEWANVEGKTPLHVAAMKGNEELVRVS